MYLCKIIFEFQEKKGPSLGARRGLYVDDLEIDKDTSPDYKPELINTGETRSQFKEAIQFGQRFNLSTFVITMMINLVLKG